MNSARNEFLNLSFGTSRLFREGNREIYTLLSIEGVPAALLLSAQLRRTIHRTVRY
jgi:hypothetical protein